LLLKKLFYAATVTGNRQHGKEQKKEKIIFNFKDRSYSFWDAFQREWMLSNPFIRKFTGRHSIRI